MEARRYACAREDKKEREQPTMSEGHSVRAGDEPDTHCVPKWNSPAAARLVIFRSSPVELSL